jgi:hypothetical protein
MAQMREGNKGANSFVDFLQNTVRSTQIVGSNEFPNFVEVCEGIW